MKTGKEKKLSKLLEEKQKEKGTFDSLCMSICNYSGEHNICQTCFMMQEEKVRWKKATRKEKDIILNIIAKRISK